MPPPPDKCCVSQLTVQTLQIEVMLLRGLSATAGYRFSELQLNSMAAAASAHAASSALSLLEGGGQAQGA